LQRAKSAPFGNEALLAEATQARIQAVEAAVALPEDEREVFDLVGIQGLTQAEAAAVVGVSKKTVQRRLNRARLLLADRLADLRPSTPGEPPPPGDTPTP
jgi:RNA polymerase sigma-70 factor (ECF subfamily)